MSAVWEKLLQCALRSLHTEMKNAGNWLRRDDLDRLRDGPWTPTDWSTFMQVVRTNSEVQGWQYAFNRVATCMLELLLILQKSWLQQFNIVVR